MVTLSVIFSLSSIVNLWMQKSRLLKLYRVYIFKNIHIQILKLKFPTSIIYEITTRKCSVYLGWNYKCEKTADMNGP